MTSLVLRWLLLIVSVLLIGACGTGSVAGNRDSENAEEDTIESGVAMSTQLEDEAVFIESLEPSEEYLAAALRARIIVDGNGCLRLGGKGGDLPVWPHEYSLGNKAGESVILDENGEAVARIGQMISAGGGQVTAEDGPPGESRQVFQERRQELGIPAKCKGSLWYVAPPVRVVEQ